MLGKMRGIDVSRYQGQAGFDPAKVPADFIICKATQGNSWRDPSFTKLSAGVLACGKLFGAYHFADGKTSGYAEAGWFLDNVKSYIGKGLLVLDWEGDALHRGPGYAMEFCDRVYNETGIIPILYTGTGIPGNYNWTEFIKKYPYFWGAEYGTNPKREGYISDGMPDRGRNLKGFKQIIRQYSSNTYLPGYPNRLDANIAFIDKAEWNKLSKKNGSIPIEEKFTDYEVAMKIINKENGWAVNGDARKKKLAEAGYDYKKVQDIINKIIKDRAAGIEWYVVKKGDNLSKIAKANGITLAQIKDLNKDNIKNFNSLSIGQWVRVK